MALNRYELAEEYVRRYRLQKIWGRDPIVFLDLHPDGGAAALQGAADGADQAAVFDLASGEILWQPEGVLALCWLPHRRDMLLIRGSYRRELETHEGLTERLSPAQGEFLQQL